MLSSSSRCVSSRSRRANSVGLRSGRCARREATIRIASGRFPQAERISSAAADLESTRPAPATRCSSSDASVSSNVSSGMLSAPARSINRFRLVTTTAEAPVPGISGATWLADATSSSTISTRRLASSDRSIADRRSGSVGTA